MTKKTELPKKQDQPQTTNTEPNLENTKKDTQLADLTDTLKRVQAEFENYQKRTIKENDAFRAYAVEKFIIKLLPILDTFDAAIKHQTHTSTQDGIALIHAQLLKILEAEGVKRIDTIGKKYQHDTMEVLLTQQSDKPDMVLEELQAGYTLGTHVLRIAKVKISVTTTTPPNHDNAEPNTT